MVNVALRFRHVIQARLADAMGELLGDSAKSSQFGRGSAPPF